MIKSERLYSNGCGGIAFPINGTVVYRMLTQFETIIYINLN